MQNDKQSITPAANPDQNKGELKPARFEEQQEQQERLWKHESEIPDASNKPGGPTERSQGEENY